MEKHLLKSDLLLLLTATIWGFAFVAQRVGMVHVGPFTFNGIRFLLGGLSLTPLLVLQQRRRRRYGTPIATVDLRQIVAGGGLAGLLLFTGASLQQIGLVHTTAGKAGFITGLYVVIVPLLGLFWRQRPDIGTWIGAALAAAGLYLLSVTDTFTIAYGDLLELLGAFFWAGHVLLIGWLSRRIDPVLLALLQNVACAAFSIVAAILLETITTAGIRAAAVPILYGGIMSVGVAYTLQVVAQRNAHPAHAAILLSLESVFAAVGGWLFIGETLSLRSLSGCALMLAGMLASQAPLIYAYRRRRIGTPASSR